MINGKFEKMGYVSGVASTTEPREYSRTDSMLNQGTQTYRLKQIDYDGSFEYSNQIEVEVSSTVQFTLE